jgi:16S rRNA (uracil1498-N3)-methyltransferase
MFSERGGDSFASVKPGKKITALIGPEGGWDDSEIETAKKYSCTIVTLGGRVLRAETAAISIAAILQHRFGDMS